MGKPSPTVLSLGASSWAFSSLFLLSIFMCFSMAHAQRRSRLHAFGTGETHSYFHFFVWIYLKNSRGASLVICLVPAALATYVACTRILDYWHHYTDVVTGSLLGMGCAAVAFWLYFDRLYPSPVERRLNKVRRIIMEGAGDTTTDVWNKGATRRIVRNYCTFQKRKDDSPKLHCFGLFIIFSEKVTLLN